MSIKLRWFDPVMDSLWSVLVYKVHYNCASQTCACQIVRVRRKYGTSRYDHVMCLFGLIPTNSNHMALR
jgi:hypothetical protein